MHSKAPIWQSMEKEYCMGTRPLLLYTAVCEIKVIGYSLGRVPCSKCDNLQCSIAPDYGYKRWSTKLESHLVRTQSQKE